MDYTKITQIILVDDKPLSYADGGAGATTREHQYLQLFAILHESLPNVHYVHIIADGSMHTYIETQSADGAVYYEEAAKCSLSRLDKPDVLASALKNIANGDISLLLMDYILDDDIDKGKALVRRTMHILDVPDLIKILYSVNSEIEEITPCTCIWGFPISHPVDAAEEVMHQLEQLT